MSLIPRSLRLVPLVLLALLASACSTTPTVQTDYNSAYDFGRARAFAIVEPATVSNSVAMSTNDILHNRISSAIGAALTARGFEVVEPAQADMLVSFLVTTENKTEIHEYNTGFAYQNCWRCGPYLGASSIDVDQYTEGTLFVDFIDPKSKQLQWRGTVSKRLSKSRTMEERKQMVDEIVTNVIAQFPPGP
jgi:Domain of unknown function (DUF4136)